MTKKERIEKIKAMYGVNVDGMRWSHLVELISDLNDLKNEERPVLTERNPAQAKTAYQNKINEDESPSNEELYDE